MTTTCTHERTVIETSGSQHFTAGEVDDNITERVVCRDCLAVLSDEIGQAMTCPDCGEDYSMLPNEAESLERHGRCMACQYVHEIDEKVAWLRRGSDEQEQRD